jgi:hypothetical protein
MPYRYPRHARIGSGARRAQWRELERWTGTDEARARRAQIDNMVTIPLDEDHFPRLSPEPPDATPSSP